MKNEHYNVIYMVTIYTILCLLAALILDKANAETREEIEQQIVKTAVENNVDPTLALAIAEVESKFNVNAVGTRGELGLFQLRPEFHSVIKGATRNNIVVGIKYIALLQRKCKRYGDAFFVCFNYGPNRRLSNPRHVAYYHKVKAIQYRRQVTNIASIGDL